MRTVRSGFDVEFIVARAKLILSSPRICWDSIAIEQKSAKEVLISYGLPLIVVHAVCTFTLDAILGIATPIGVFRVPVFRALFDQLYSVVLLCGLLFAGGAVTSVVAKKFGGKADIHKGVAWLAYSQTPTTLGSVCMLLPLLGFLSIPLAVYGLYICFQGVDRMLSVPSARRVTFFFANILAMIVVVGIPIVILAFLLEMMGLTLKV